MLQECVSHVGIDFELENLSQLLHVGCSSGHLGSQSGVIIARKGEDWSLYLCHCGEVRRGAIEAYGSVYPRYLRSAFPSKASAVAEAGDPALAIRPRQLQGIVSRRLKKLYLFGDRAGAQRLGQIVWVLE